MPAQAFCGSVVIECLLNLAGVVGETATSLTVVDPILKSLRERYRSDRPPSDFGIGEYTRDQVKQATTSDNHVSQKGVPSIPCNFALGPGEQRLMLR